MKKLVVKQSKLRGIVNVAGSKNSALPIIACSMLSPYVTLKNIPKIADIDNLLAILADLGCKYEYKEDKLVLTPNLVLKPIMHKEVRMFRASYYLMGVYLALFKEVEIAYPGGCSLGNRPIDYHLEGFKKLGCCVTECSDRIIIKATDLKPGEIKFPKKSLGATINIALLASSINGITKMENISCEPEVLDFLKFMKKLGVKIRQRKNTIWIEGTNNKKEVVHRIIPDRIVAGTFIALGLVNGPISIVGANTNHLANFITPLKQANALIDIKDGVITAYPSKLSGVNIKVGEYPAFSTDLQQILLPVLSTAKGDSIIEETIFNNRFKVVDQLNKMGCKIKVEDNKAFIKGGQKLKAADVFATDLRAGAALLIASSIARGKTTINGAEYIERGYGDIYAELKKLNLRFKVDEIEEGD